MLAVVLLLVAGALFFWKMPSSGGRSAVAVAQLAPADTLFFAQVSDVPRTQARWRETALFRLTQEPEVQAFLEKPLAQAPALAQWRAHAERLARAQPRQAFVAVTSVEASATRFTAGFSFAGSRADVEALLAEPRRAVRDAWPAGKAELLSHAGTEIELFSEKGNTVAEAFRDGWYFVANDLALLQATLDRQARPAGTQAGGSLAGDELFQRSLKPLPLDADAVVFLRSGALMDRLAGVMAAAGQQLGSVEMSELQKTPAIAASTKLEGAGFRDTIFMAAAAGAAKEPALPRQTLGLSTPDTVLYYSAVLPPKTELPASAAPLMAFLPALAAAEQALAAKGLKFADLGAAFGPEFSTLLDWPKTAGQPSLLLSLGVRDAAKARAFTEALAGDPGTPGAWTRQAQDGATLYSPAMAGGVPSLISPSLALTEKALLLGLTSEALTGGMARLRSGGAGLSETPEYQAAVKAVGEPTTSFAFLDLRKLVDRAYGLARPFVAMSLAFNPEANRYVDAGKLPGTETLSKHLGPAVYSQSVSENGTLIESVGALTFNQAIFGGAVAAGAAAFPMLQQQLQGGGLNLPVQPLSPGAPASPPAANPPPPPAAPAAPAPEAASPAPPVEAFHAPATNFPS